MYGHIENYIIPVQHDLIRSTINNVAIQTHYIPTVVDKIGQFEVEIGFNDVICW